MIQTIQNDNFLSLYGGGTINGDNVVGFTSPAALKRMIGGYQDKASVLSNMFSPDDEKAHDTYLGVVNLMATTTKVDLPLLTDMLSERKVLKIKPEGRVTYDLPIPKDANEAAMVTVDTSQQAAKGTLGVENVPFYIILDTPYTSGDFLKPDPTGPYMVRVSTETPVEPYGDYYKHWVSYTGNGKSRDFPSQYLKSGNRWYKIGHKNGEYGTEFSTITSKYNAPGFIRMQWTPSSVRTVEVAYTRQAGRISSNAAYQLKQSTVESLNDKLFDMGGFDEKGAMFSGTYNAEKKSLQVARVDSTLEYLAMVELTKMEAWELMFAELFEEKGAEGNIKMNEGLWRQYRRGKIITYSRPGGLTLAHLQEAASYYFKNDNTPLQNRYITFKGGLQVVNNGVALLNNYAVNQLSALPVSLMGQTTVLTGNDQKVVTGPVGDMTLRRTNFTEVFLPNIGYVKFVHDPAFDFNFGTSDPRVSGYEGMGVNRNTYTLVVDTISTRGSNDAYKSINGARLVNGGKENSPVYYVTPEGQSHVTWGRSNGRAPGAGQIQTNISSALKYMGTEFWCYSESDVILLDTTRCVVIELQDTYAS